MGRTVVRASFVRAAALGALLLLLLASNPQSVIGSDDQQAAVPAAPEVVAVHVISEDSVFVEWQSDDEDDSITGYRILRGLSEDSLDVIEEDTGLEFAGPGWGIYEDITPPPGRTVWYAVQARNAAGLSPRSNAFEAAIPGEAIPDPGPPAAPTGLTGTAEHDRVSLTWDDPGDDSITGYQVLRGTRVEGEETEFQVLVDDTASAEASYVDTGVEPETAYAYRIRARNANGLGPESGDFDADTPAPPVPAAPNLLGTALSDGQVTLIWSQDPPDDSITGYRILRGDSEDSLAELVEDTGSTDTSYTDTDPPAGRTVYYAVQARNAAGLSEQSNTRSVNTPAAETEEDPLVAAPQESGEIVLVSTIEQPAFAGNQNTPGTQYVAQSFTTGPLYTGNLTNVFTITQVQFQMSGINSPRVKAEIRSGASLPGRTVYTLDLDGTIPSTTGTVTFNAPNNARLLPDTKYWVLLLTQGATNVIAVNTVTGSDALDPGSPGWEVGQAQACNATLSSCDTLTHKLRMRINGEARTFLGVQPADKVLVSNFDMADRSNPDLFLLSGTVNSNGEDYYRVGMPFRTGPDAGGYDLGFVRLGVQAEGDVIPPGGYIADVNVPRVSIWSDASGSPGAKLQTLVGSRDLTQRENDFHVEGSFTLSPSTTYWVVVENTRVTETPPDGADIFRLREKVMQARLDGLIRNFERGFSPDTSQASTSRSGWSTYDTVKYQGYDRAWCSRPLEGWTGGCNASSVHLLRMALFEPLDASDPFFRNLDGMEGADPVVFSIPEDASGGTKVGTIVVHHLDGEAISISKTGDTAAFDSKFSLNFENGEITLKPGASLDYETDATNTYTITVTVTDGEDSDGNPEAIPTVDDTTTLTIRVTDVHEPGNLVLSTDAPRSGQEVTATLNTDLEIVSANFTWRCTMNRLEPLTTSQWAPSDGGAPASSYTPTHDDYDDQCKIYVTAQYDDANGNYYFLVHVFPNAVSSTNRGSSQTQIGANTPATGVPGITGTASLDETLTADTSGIADEDGMTGAVFTYQWIRRDLGTATDEDIQGATASTYTVTAEDEGYGIRVRVTFTDDAGNEESLTSITLLSAPPIIIPDDEDVSNTPATGAPTISGTARVGETLMADTSAIADEDGLTYAEFAYQWLSDDTDIPDATGSTYTLSEDDVGKTIKVTVTFIDDAGYDESLTSDPTEPVAPRANTPATGAPAISGSALVGQTLTADTSTIADDDGLTSPTFAYQWLADDTAIPDATASTYTASQDDAGKTIKVTVTFTDDAGNEESLTSAATEAVAPRANTPATGAPTVSGSALVGETLTADTSAIADDDGLTNAAFAYEWLADDTAIPDATASTYTLSEDDVGKTIRVRVTFTDDEGNEESLTSAATAAVKPLLTATFHDAPDPHDGTNTFTFELRFSENIPISYRTLRDHAFTVTGGEVTQARRLNPSGDSRNLRWEITVRPDGDGAVTIVLPATGDCNDDGAICTADDRKLSNRLELVVPRSGG